MKFLLLFLLALASTASANTLARLTDFELTDQDQRTRTYRFPKSKVTVMTIADHKGSDQLAPWIERVYQRYEKRIDIDGVADVSMIPRPFHGMFRAAFRKQLTYSVMLDWGGSVVKQFAYEKGVANIYVIDRSGTIVKRLKGAVNDDAARDLFRAVDRALAE